MDGFAHKSVLLQEAVDALAIKPQGIYVDGTAGGGGHSYEIARRLTTGRLICLDRDPDAIAAAGERLREFKCAVLVQSEFSKIGAVLDSLGVEYIDGLLLDLGVSSHQLDSAQRGFSYHNDAPLDMRMSRSGTDAAELVNTLSAPELARIMFEYADEKFAHRIAQRIVERREQQPFTTTAQLAALVSECYPAKLKRDGHPARRVFQALRMAVNEELLEQTVVINDAFERLNSGGRMSIITFHSIEDRLVKQAFAKLTRGCECPPDFPVCVCGKTPRARLVNRKPIVAGADELEQNQRSRSAKLRILEKI